MDFVTIAQNFGVPVAAMFCLSLAVWKGIVFIGNCILKPLVESHVAFLNDLRTSVHRQEELAAALHEKQMELAEKMDGACGYREIHRETIEKAKGPPPHAKPQASG